MYTQTPLALKAVIFIASIKVFVCRKSVFLYDFSSSLYIAVDLYSARALSVHTLHVSINFAVVLSLELVLGFSSVQLYFSFFP